MFQKIIDDLIGTPGGPEEQEQAASRLIETCGYAAGAATLVPLPGTELIAVTSIHVGMVVGLSQIYGTDMSRESALELLTRIGTTVGASVVTTRVATTFAKIALPGLGGFVGAPLMFATTLALGAVARTFLANPGEMSAQEMKDLYKQTMKSAKSAYDPSRAKGADMQEMAQQAAQSPAESDGTAPSQQDSTVDPVERLKTLQRLQDAGLIDAEEYETQRRRILEGI